MKQGLVGLLLLSLGFLLVACGGGGEASPVEAPTVLPDAPEPILPTMAASLPPLTPPAAGPIRPGCGDYRLLVTIQTDAIGVGVRVAGPANAVDVVWNLSGPGLEYRDPPPEPRVFNEDNREVFGIEANEGHEGVEARFLLLVSGVQAGQRLRLEMGQEGPGETGTEIAVYNARGGIDLPGEELARIQVAQEYQTLEIDLCSAGPMPLPEKTDGLPPRLLAFYYPWWSTTAEPGPPYECGGDPFGWIREVDGKATLVTGHTPIARDGDQIIYTQTACWQEITDERGRTGTIYDVQEVNFLAEQMRLAKAAGLDGFAVSVHGDNPQEMDYLAGKVLPIAEQAGFRIAPLYEAPETGWTYDDERDVALVGEHLRRLVEMLADHLATLTVARDGVEQVVIFVDPGSLARFPSPEAWEAIRAIVDEAGVPYFLWSGPGAFAWVFQTGFDGVYNDLEVIETYEPPLGLPPYALRDERRLAYRAAAWAARERGMPLALPVVPGWEGAEVLWEPGYVPLPRDYGAPGEYGTYYRVRWEDALEQSPDWIVITSWNEWVEGTEIEPSDKYPPSRFSYLQATREYACIWRGGTDCQ